MRGPTSAEGLRRLLSALSKEANEETALCPTGGATAARVGPRDSTVDAPGRTIIPAALALGAYNRAVPNSLPRRGSALADLPTGGPLIGQTLAHYRITAALGAGGMGQVYRATDTSLGRDVAIKVLPPEVAQDPERLARFRREAHLLASLNHPNIAAIYGLEEAEGKPFLALDLVEGEDLKERLARGAIRVDKALEIAEQIAEALEDAHSKGIVHRDLKPANVKLTPEGKVKVLDFGLAKTWGGDAGSGGSSIDLSQSPTLARTGTLAGVILGTAAYMSPEQASGKGVDKRADIWSFGVVLFEMLTGQSIFGGETPAEVMASVIKEEPVWERLPPGCSPAITKLLRRCLRKRPRERLQDIGDARLEIQDVLAGTAVEGGRSSADLEKVRRERRRRPRELSIWATTLVVAAGLGWFFGLPCRFRGLRRQSIAAVG